MERAARTSLFALGAALVGLACASCSSSDAKEGTTTPDTGTTRFTIKIAHNDWLTAELNDTIASILLREQLGYDVEFVPLNTTEQWPRIASGDVHISLEAWPGHDEAYEKYINVEHSVENLGDLGPIGKVGWFLPTYLVTTHPELSTWKGLQNASNVELFQTALTSPAGRFVGGPNTWQQYDDQIISNLKLDFKVVHLESEEAVLAELDSQYSLRRGMLFYFWYPHWAFAKYELTDMQLPPYTAECYAKATTGGVDCGYPTSVLFKIAWAGLKTAAPTAYVFLKNFSYATQTQISLMGDVKLNGKTVEQAARAWINDHESTWRAWIAAK